MVQAEILLEGEQQITPKKLPSFRLDKKAKTKFATYFNITAFVTITYKTYSSSSGGTKHHWTKPTRARNRRWQTSSTSSARPKSRRRLTTTRRRSCSRPSIQQPRATSKTSKSASFKLLSTFHIYMYNVYCICDDWVYAPAHTITVRSYVFVYVGHRGWVGRNSSYLHAYIQSCACTSTCTCTTSRYICNANHSSLQHVGT